jgi:hypothetical protein
MRRAVGRRNSLPAAACDAIAQLLEGFLAEERAGDGGGTEVRAAIALLREASRQKGVTVETRGSAGEAASISAPL